MNADCKDFRYKELIENLDRFAHNWNVGTMEQWNIGFWETAGVVYWQNPIDKEVNK